MKWTAILALAAAAVGVSSAQSACPPYFDDFSPDPTTPVCLHFVRSKATWSNTRAYCQMIGADLAKLTGDLHQQVVQYIKSLPPDDLQDEAFWVGGSDAEQEGKWIWVADREPIPLGTPHWYPCNDQPNNGLRQNCLSLYTPDFYFHSLECSRLTFGICQI